MSGPRRIHLTPIHEHIAETQSALQHAVFFVVLVMLTAGVAYQAFHIDRQMAVEARV
ncbi:hypothetical protein SAMN03159496_04679 [Rhizobium sp. NFR07]|uniref:hypothetical protein n=1 Tax=Rhizobium sp. NFR07 TaxID=1566262 RepID=UPI0008EC92A9|nr:hypothetical protein [Rhizobium sp. NFR07]SFB52670.1 hypothetical protein SAMN03159496_04679 [Rhizobium sp. NFR07]